MHAFVGKRERAVLEYTISELITKSIRQGIILADGVLGDFFCFLLLQPRPASRAFVVWFLLLHARILCLRGWQNF